MPRVLRLPFALLVVLVLAHGVQAVSGAGGPAVTDAFSTWVYTAIEVGGCLLCLARVVRVPAERATWALTTATLVTWTVADLLWTVWLNGVAAPPMPNVTDWLYWLGYLTGYAAIMLLLRARLRPFRPSLCLDGAIAGLGAAAFTVALVLAPIRAATHGSATVVGVTLTYPVLDLLMAAFVLLAFGLSGWRPDRGLLLLGLGELVSAVSDGVYSYQASAGTYAVGTLVDTGWPAAIVLLAAAAWQPASHGRSEDHGWSTAVMPAVSALGALGLLGYAAFHGIGPVASGLALAALAVAGIRAALMWRENVRLLARAHAQAHVDGLSGLPNRRALSADLDDAAASRAPRRLVFFDLNGFKGYNDAFGHAAGDALLRRLGTALSAAVAGHGRAYRLGGDEFCALLDDDASVEAAAAALADEGPEFSISAAYGVVRMPEDASDATQALQLADERMYADKRSGRPSSRRQTRDVLLQVLTEREPALNAHADGVTASAVALGRALDVGGEDLDVLARAAELHDVGKVAIPEKILRKPAALDDAEWALMRQHTVIGERIVSAAPALRPVGRLVRSSHERWAGGGYPDGLAGEEIPLGARIIAVCDAYDAMTSDRPYRAALPHAEALAELRRCAGSQFDPAIVRAFAALDVSAAGARSRPGLSSGARPACAPAGR